MIYCANNNTLYRYSVDVCEDLGLDPASICKHLAGQRKSVGSYVLARVTDTDAENIKAVRAWLLYSAYKIIIDVQDEPRVYDRGDKNDYQKKHRNMGSHSEY